MSDDSPKTAVAWMLFASFSFGSMNALVKWTSPDADVWSMVFVRSIVIGVVIYSICKQRGVNLRVIDQRSMFLRCSTGLIAMILYFSALGLIPIGQAVTLQYTNPLFVALLSGAFLSEKVQPIVFAMAIFVIHWYSNDCFSRSQERRIQCNSGPRFRILRCNCIPIRSETQNYRTRIKHRLLVCSFLSGVYSHSRSTEPPFIAIRPSLDDVFDWHRSRRGGRPGGSYICFSQGKCRLDKRFFLSDCDYRYDVWLRFLWGKS